MYEAEYYNLNYIYLFQNDYFNLKKMFLIKLIINFISNSIILNINLMYIL